MPAMDTARRLLLLLAVVALLRATTTTADEIFTEFTCSPQANYTDKSPYAKNLDELLSVLATPDPATVDNWWFRSLTVGTGPGHNNASGLAMCWADADAAWCRDCLYDLRPGINYLYLSCYHSRNVSFLMYNGCVIRYADAPFLGSADRSGGPRPRLLLRSHEVARNATGMREARGRLLTQLAEMAGRDARRFATGSQGFVDAVTNKTQVVYGLAQCTRDLPPRECTGCLLDYLAVMYSNVSITNATSAAAMGFSCYLRYEVNKPIDIAGLAQPPSPPPTPEHPAGSAAPPPVVSKTMLVAALAMAAGAIITWFNA